MKLAYLSPPQSVKPSQAPETPFLRARQEWDERMGRTTAQAGNWRMAFFVMAIFSIALCVALVVQTSQRKLIPIIVGIDKRRGEAQVLNPDGSFTPNTGAAEVKYFITEFIRYVRSVPRDPVVVRSNFERAYALLRPEAAELLNSKINEDKDSALHKIGNLNVSIQPVSVVLIPETSTYQVRWQESVYADGGRKVDEYIMNGAFNVEMGTPQSEQEFRLNPLGIYISHFEWSREL